MRKIKIESEISLDEITEEVISTLKLFEPFGPQNTSQVRNGMWMRAALIATIFNVDARIIDHYHSHYAH